MDDIVTELTATLGSDCVLTGQDVSGRQAGIWRSDTIRAKALVLPRSTGQVSEVLRICHRHGQSVVPQGGLTGLVGGALTAPEDIALSLERMNRIEAIDPVNRTMVVESGVILQVLQETADQHGLMFPLDLGGRGSCTIGGNISTNAGGNRVIRYGMTRDMVLGLEVVLADGTVLSTMNHMIKNNAGYDLKHLFIGSEGTLGVVTRAVLRLREKPELRATLLVAVDQFAKLSQLLKHMDARLGGALSAFEVMWKNFYSLVTTPPAENQAPIARDYPYYVLLEAMGADEAKVEEAMAQAIDEGLVVDAVLAQSEAQRLQLWAIRDSVDQCRRVGPTYAFDVSMRISQMADYVAEVDQRLRSSFGEVNNFTFGHMGDGNLHLLVTVGRSGSEVRQQIESCVYEPLVAVGGSVSAEHGIGLEKKPYLNLCRNEAELAIMRAIKSALDSQGILNPGKIFDPTAVHRSG